MKEREFCEKLLESSQWYDEATQFYENVESFEQRKITTGAFGFVFTMEDGSEFQVSVVKSKLGRDE